MPEEGTQDNTEEEPQEESGQNGQQSLRPRWLSDTVAALICLALGGVLGTLGAALLNGHPKPVLTAWTFIFFAVVAAGGVAYFSLKNHRKRQVRHKMPKWLPLWSFIGITVVGACVSTFAILHEKPEPAAIVEPPRLVLELTASTSTHPLWLTNKSLFTPLEGGEFASLRETNAWVLVPIVAKTLTWISFGLVNTSTNGAEDVRVRIIFGNTFNCIATNGWLRLKHGEGYPELRWSIGFIRDEPEVMPPIFLPNDFPSENERQVPVLIEISGRNFSPIFLGFWLSVFTNKEDIGPQVVSGWVFDIKQTDGTNKFQLVALKTEDGSMGFTHISSGNDAMPFQSVHITNHITQLYFTNPPTQ